MLMEGADCIVALPGGLGTWDELWEMVCLKGIGEGRGLRVKKKNFNCPDKIVPIYFFVGTRIAGLAPGR